MGVPALVARLKSLLPAPRLASVATDLIRTLSAPPADHATRSRARVFATQSLPEPSAIPRRSAYGASVQTVFVFIQGFA